MPTTISLSLATVDGPMNVNVVIAVRTPDGRVVGTVPACPLVRSAASSDVTPSLRKLDDKTLAAVVSIIEVKLASEVQIDMLAAGAGISMHHFCRRFKITVGMSPYACVTAIRMVWARWLLVDSSLSTEDIAARVGIGHVGNFRKNFRRHFGINPSLMRASTGQGG
ncbi:AraC family transcriptional regulator [Rhodopseudomonas sp. P2A-2r]|uniref:helix-turn-helix domain-containing protein n=1 Tax=Rhodopseudomonas sp. P2A-2r TaxID=2991972 RepID=UPI00223462CF|nr:AraC family transcriptional regulator [Rhodopseudomonas sp. P2A-2r]UZE50498.1 AraC family transcriptional regulator [Rhodopseudomonas sp. P2A-2r]